MRIPTTFKLSARTKKQIAWLQQRLGSITATDVVSVAVADLYERKRAEFTARLIARHGSYDFQIGGVTVAKCGAAIVKRLPREQREALLGGGAPHSGALAALALAGAVAGEKMTLYPEAIASVYGS